MSITYWVLIAWVKSASILQMTPPTPIDGPYDTLQQCRVDAQNYSPLKNAGAHLACEKHVAESADQTPINTPSPLQDDTCHALQLQGYLVDCGQTDFSVIGTPSDEGTGYTCLPEKNGNGVTCTFN